MRTLTNQFLDSLGTLLLVFGAGLLLVGLAVQMSRAYAMRQVTSASANAPSFEDTLREPTNLPSGRMLAPALTTEPVQGASMASPPSRVVIPKIDIDAPVVEVGYEARIINGKREGNIWQTADYAAGHHMFSSYPGEDGNVVLSGHNNEKGAVFRDIYKLVPGDMVHIKDSDGNNFSYEVVESFVVPEENASPEERQHNTHWIRETIDERLTLVSCFPPWSNSHRSIVVGFRTPDDSADMAPDPSPDPTPDPSR